MKAILAARFIPACAGNTTFRALPRHAQAVHPRVCGEHRGRLDFLKPGAGSSPRVRGTPRDAGGGAVKVRFIPACAGNTRRCRGRLDAKAVHPRVCGEHAGAEIPARPVGGSSPRVRGTRPAPAPEHSDTRFIPACAGNTRRQDACGTEGAVHPRVCGEHLNFRTPANTLIWFIPACAGNTYAPCPAPPPTPVHPRVCGEHSWRGILSANLFGSSPRVRGTRAGHPLLPRRCRFIPACAGNTKSITSHIGMAPVHPRVCGEHRPPASVNWTKPGSSPRVRGTHVAGDGWQLRDRFIPACAGNTTQAGCCRSPAPVHPRVCGEHAACKAQACAAPGSSPRVRGTREAGLDGLRRGRFIPACAGNTRRRSARPRNGAVHPRVCGEHVSVPCTMASPCGSSPRVRGTRQRLVDLSLEARFIPACAGNTRRQRREAQRHPVHPRVCGEHHTTRTTLAHAGGSSPRVRGTPIGGREVRQRVRFIPACAGNTSSAG